MGRALRAGGGEAAERYALALVPPDREFGDARSLVARGMSAPDPAAWALFDASQHPSLPFAPFTDRTPIAWVPAHDLTADRVAHVPCCLVYMPYAPTLPGERLVGYATSTGAAAGSTPADAALRGLMEVVERDAFVIVWRNRLPCPRIEVDDGAPFAAEYRERFARPGLRYSLFLTTLDLPFCSVFGVLEDASGPRPRLTVGGACHLDPAQAVRKTCLELVQGMKWLEHMGDAGFPLVDGFSNVRQFEDRIRLYGFNDLRPAFDFLSTSAETVPLSTLSAAGSAPRRAEDALRAACDVLRAHDLQVLARDVTPPDVRSCGLSVVKVLVPQAQAMEGDVAMELLGGRRWRDVPVRAGRRPAPIALDARNPFPHPYP